MTPVTIGLVAIAMSADSFVAALAKGTHTPRPDWRRVVQTGAIFGLIEALTPLLGWALGVTISRYINAVDHWIAFGLLATVGGRMVLAAVSARPTTMALQNATLWALVVTALATSIDAMAVGVSLAFADVNIIALAITTGLATMTMSATGLLAGHYLGLRFGRMAEALGGVTLISMGSFILLQHLTA